MLTFGFSLCLALVPLFSRLLCSSLARLLSSLLVSAIAFYSTSISTSTVVPAEWLTSRTSPAASRTVSVRVPRRPRSPSRPLLLPSKTSLRRDMHVAVFCSSGIASS